MITCSQCDALFPDLLDGRCITSLHAELQEQIARRDRCRDCYAVYARTVSLCRATAAAPAPDFDSRLMEALRRRLTGSA